MWVTQTTSQQTQSRALQILTTGVTTDAAYAGDGQQVNRLQTYQTNNNQPEMETPRHLTNLT